MAFGYIRDGVRRLFRIAPRSPERARADAEEELSAYVDARVEQLIATGLTPADARTEAIRRLGGSYERALNDTIRSAQHREERLTLRDLISDLRDDLRFAARGLRREPMVAAFIVITLALGIGANAAMFGVADRLLLRGPDNVVDPSRVMRILRTVRKASGGDATSAAYGWVSYDLFRQTGKSFTLAAYSVNRIGVQFGSGADAVLVPSGNATWDYFTLLGARPYLGRFFNDVEDAPDAPQNVAVLGYGLWQRAFGSDPGVIGKIVPFGGVTYSIVGVAPRGLTGPGLEPVDVWFPMSTRSAGVTSNWTKAWNAQWMQLIARIKPGATVEQAGAEATSAYRAAYAGKDAAHKTATIRMTPLTTNTSGNETAEIAITRWLVGVSIVVLLIACANVANLLLARAVRRRREVAVRVALGAGRGRLVRLLLTESGLLAVLGAVAGLAVAASMAALMRRVLLPGIEWTASPVGARVIAVSFALALVVGVLTGLAPALRTGHSDLTAALKAGAREGGGRASRLRGLLTVSQAALSIILLVGAGLFVRSFANVNGLDLGIQTDRILVVQLRYPTVASIANKAVQSEAANRREVLLEAMRRARTQPSVENSSVTIGLPFQSSFGESMRVPGWDSIPEVGGHPIIAAVGPAYFATVGTRVLEGRAFTDGDRGGSEPVVIVNHTMSSVLWPGKSPLGECVYWGPTPESLTTCSRVVGVVADQHNWGLREAPIMNYFVPFGQENGFGGTSLLVRPKDGRMVEATAMLRRLLLEVDPSISYVSVKPLQQEVDLQTRPWRLGATVFSLMGVLALLVAAIGLYSVLSYLVAQRTREIGVRIALGAQASSIVALIMRSSVGMTLAGIVIGSIVSLWAAPLIEPLLFNTSARDPLVLGGVALMLLTVAVIAAIVPAARARRVDPIEALRSD